MRSEAEEGKTTGPETGVMASWHFCRVGEPLGHSDGRLAQGAEALAWPPQWGWVFALGAHFALTR